VHEERPTERRAAGVDGARKHVIPEIALVAVVAAAELGGTAAASTHQTGYGTFGVAPITLLALGVAALPFRRRFPVAVLAIAFATTLAYWSLGYPRGPVFFALLVSFVTAILLGHRTAAIVAIVAGFLTFPWLGYLVGRTPGPTIAGVLGLAAWLTAVFSITELVRSRRERARDAQLSREETMRRRAADERLRIAQELHDVVAHSMSLINLRAGVALHLLDTDREQARAALAAIKDVSKDGLVELRSILGVLRQVEEVAPRSPVPTLDRLEELVDRARLSGVSVRVETEGDLTALPRNVDLAAYRIIQESLTNVARHSNRPDAVVRLSRRNGVLDIDIVDGGSHIAGDPAVLESGHGITGMRERAASVGGVLTAGPRARGGFEVHAHLPADTSA
jgi:signal transduction histidine kinase